MAHEIGDKKFCILVVEDEPMLLLMAIDLVEEAGFEAVGAVNADQAIVILEARQDIRIIFTDIDMPPGSMNGLKLVAAVRDRWPPIGIIVTSGHMNVSPGDLPARSKFFSKPYDSRAVVNMFREMAA